MPEQMNVCDDSSALHNPKPGAGTGGWRDKLIDTDDELA
jgi:hypothetical protein